MQNRSKDYLIVGQGIAGSLLAAALIAQGKTVLVIDNRHHEASSVVAGGDVNPITGQRFVKTWKTEELRAAMLIMYRDIWLLAENTAKNEGENQTENEEVYESFFQERSILRVLHNAKEHNDWQARAAWEAWNGYIGDAQTVDMADFGATFKDGFAIAEILQGGKVDLQNVLHTIKTYLLKSDSLLFNIFNYKYLFNEEKGVKYIDTNGDIILAKSLVFCEGWQGIHNPYFNYLPFQLSKGEALVISIDKKYNFGHFIVKNDITISRLNSGLYWVGATNSFEFVTSKPTENGRAELLTRLQNVLKIPFEIVEHRACLRPTIKDRRPLVGQHPTHKNLYILNGLGTKGASLAPYLVDELVHFLLQNKTLDKDIDISRYANLYQQNEA